MSKYPEIHEFDGAEFIRCADFDRVTAERDALQARLTAADERADVLEGHYFELKEAARQLIDNAVDDEGAGEMVVQRADIDELRPLIAALKPAEAAPDFRMIGTEKIPPMEYDEP